MKLALVGNRLKSWPAVKAVISHASTQLTHAAAEGDLLPVVMKEVPAAEIVSDPTEILVEQDVEALVVASGDADGLEMAKQFASAGRPLLIYPEAGQGSSWIYELGLIYDETSVVLFPLRLVEFHAAVAQAKQALLDAAMGKVLHVEFERNVPTAGDGATGNSLTAEIVEDAFLLDLGILRELFGTYRRVTALYSGVDGERISLATVTLAGDDVPETVWMAKPTVSKPTASEPSWRVVIRTEQGSVVLSGSDDHSQVNLEIEHPEKERVRELLTDDVGQRLVDAFQLAIAENDCQSQWSGLIHDFELLDGIHRSLRRRRTIDVHFEVASERNQFKSQMTAIGCGVLMFTLFALVAVLLAGRLLDPREQVEVEAERMNAVFLDGDFVPDTDALTEVASERLEKISQVSSNESFPILIEQLAGDEQSELNKQRLSTVIVALQGNDVQNAEQRVSLGAVVGHGFQAMMQITRIVLFVPLFLFLAAQALLWVSRPARSSSDG